jgi:hypothetical protein
VIVTLVVQKSGAQLGAGPGSTARVLEDAPPDSQLLMLDLVDMPDKDYEATDPADVRPAGLAYALRVLGLRMQRISTAAP